MAYDTATASRTFLIYSEDFSLVGDRTFTVAAYLSTYPNSMTSPTPDASSTIEIINPCLDPFSLTSTPQTDPADYIYKSTSKPSVQVILDQYISDPDASVCPITYTCEVSGPRTDICSKNDGDTVATFDTNTGDYTFTS